MKFTYQSGQRPLDGYTIKRGVGKGGFGEVYYAVSDGGKEVALKLIQGGQDIERRGILQCLNLKHPNLVGLFDLRTDAHGDSWVVMEYVAGESLHQALNRYPSGLPKELAVQWFADLAKAVGYLHDHGIVHRDLKPANIFIEDGSLKVGDCGLAKCISASQPHAHTQSIGTVHYMAPEVSTGNYGKQVDVYACGVLLYEMLTGRLPFEGETVGEILMKHLTSPPDLAGLPTEFQPILSKALAKNPAQRFASMSEFARAVTAAGGPVLDAVPVARPRPMPVVKPVNVPAAVPVERSRRELVGELCGSLAGAAVLAVPTTAATALMAKFDWTTAGQVYFLTLAVCWAVLLPGKWWSETRGDPWSRRLVMAVLGSLIGMFAVWLSGWSAAAAEPTFSTQPVAVDPWGRAVAMGREAAASGAGYLWYFALALGLMRWWKLVDRCRATRFSLGPAFGAAFWGLVLLFVWPVTDRPLGLAALTTAALIVQWVSPWEPAPTPAPRKMRLQAV